MRQPLGSSVVPSVIAPGRAAGAGPDCARVEVPANHVVAAISVRASPTRTCRQRGCARARAVRGRTVCLVQPAFGGREGLSCGRDQTQGDIDELYVLTVYMP